MRWMTWRAISGRHYRRHKRGRDGLQIIRKGLRPQPISAPGHPAPRAWKKLPATSHNAS
jgi:hypothetical protein